MDAFAPSSCPALRRSARRDAFSLVEITLAIGIVVCALLPLVGLLSVGLNSYQNSNARGPAAQVISQIAASINAATPVLIAGAVTYKAAPPYDSISWLADGTTGIKSYNFFFYEGGRVTTTPTVGKPAQLVAMAVLKSPNRAGGNFTSGTAQIAVAWPGLGAPGYTAGNPPGTIGTISFVHPQGHEETTISFVPN